jgi:pyruvate/2-oxoglutarate dehydrogenase complex dihydrolipoamide dehydrogenase (E3) component
MDRPGAYRLRHSGIQRRTPIHIEQVRTNTRMMMRPQLLPDDPLNRDLLEQVHPADWPNPEPQKNYNLVVIGGGTAGLVSAAGAAGLGAKVALVERALLGGDCLNHGCVPSKALIRSARVFGELRNAGSLGIKVSGLETDFPEVMKRVRAVRARISRHDSAERFKGLGVDVFLGEGRFSDARSVEVGGRKLNFSKAVIATGTRPVAPPIPGLDKAGFLTNETLFSLTELPRSLAIIGAGPIGCEMAQAFSRFGCQVTLLEIADEILIKEDQDAAKIVRKSLEESGVKIFLGVKLEKVENTGDGRKQLFLNGASDEPLTVSEILVSAGRLPNVEGLNLEAAGVKHDRAGVTVNDLLQTSNSRIFAAGDVCMPFKFTHAADFAARTVIQNSLFMGRKKLSALTIPWVTFTDPEIAHVGLNERDAGTRNIPVDVYRKDFKDVDRAITDGEEEGLVKIITRKGSDRILGATIVAPHAGEMIGELSLAMSQGIGLGRMATAIHPYPTQAESIRQLGDAYNRTRLTPLVKSLFSRWMAWTR